MNSNCITAFLSLRLKKSTKYYLKHNSYGKVVIGYEVKNEG